MCDDTNESRRNRELTEQADRVIRRGFDALISVIVPFYNVEQWIGDAIESVIVQTHREWELILVDDGSTDQSADVADRWAAIDGRIRVIRLPHGGVSIARNVGLDEARGTYVTFLDADDILERDALNRLLAAAHRHAATVVYGGYIRTDLDGRLLSGIHFTVMEPERVYGSDAVLRRYARGGIRSAIWGVLYRRELTDRNRFNPGRISNDAVFAPLLLGASPRTVMIADTVYRYRNRPGSIVNTLNRRRLDSIRSRVRVCRLVFRRFSDPRTRAFCIAAICNSASGLARRVCVAAEEISDPASRRRHYSIWRRRIYRLVPRHVLLIVALNPWTPVRGRIIAGTMIPGLRVHAVIVGMLMRVRRVIPERFLLRRVI